MPVPGGNFNGRRSRFVARRSLRRARVVTRGLRLRVELAPALEALGEQSFNLLGAQPIRLDPFDVLLVIAGRAHPRAQRVLFALERLERGGKRVELALLLERQSNPR